MEKLKLEVSGDRKRKIVITERDMYVSLGGMFNLRFAKYYLYVNTVCHGLCPSGHVWDDGNATAEDIRELLEDAIEQVKDFDKAAALAELEQALKQVDEIVELVK